MHYNGCFLTLPSQIPLPLHEQLTKPSGDAPMNGEAVDITKPLEEREKSE